jgi:hypothetical protein
MRWSRRGWRSSTCFRALRMRCLRRWSRSCRSHQTK